MTEKRVASSSLFTPDAAVPAASGGSDHYLGLDLLRGLAALAVVLFHCSSRLDLPLLFAHGYLAVDFFFVLSGFVITKAYGERLASGRLPLRRFAFVRAIRLMPLVAVGTLLAAVIEFGRPGIADQRAHLIDIARAILCGALLLPTLVPTTLEYVVFPLNGPFWSLSLEAVANAAFAICARARAGPVVVIAALALCAPWLVWGCWSQGEIGFGAVPNGYWFGYARIGWSFSAGVLLYRFRNSAPRVPLVVPTIALLVLMLAPPSLGFLGRSFDLCSILFALPAIVWAASSARLGPKGRRWSAWSGDLSYPVYALHYPVIRAVGLLGLKLDLPVAGRISVVAVSTALILVGAGVVYSVLDVPVRRWLTARFFRQTPANLRATSEKLAGASNQPDRALRAWDARPINEP